jgi:hypothetical protein
VPGSNRRPHDYKSGQGVLCRAVRYGTVAAEQGKWSIGTTQTYGTTHESTQRTDTSLIHRLDLTGRRARLGSARGARAVGRPRTTKRSRCSWVLPLAADHVADVKGPHWPVKSSGREPSKLVVRVRSPSPAQRKCLLDRIGGSSARSDPPVRATIVPLSAADCERRARRFPPLSPRESTVGPTAMESRIRRKPWTDRDLGCGLSS